MCGIAAIFSLNQQPIERPILAAMLHTVRHRGSDGESFLIEKNYGIGHTLNRLDVVRSDAQPFDNQQLTIVFDGELENRKSLILRLNLPPSVSDIELVARAYERWEIDFLQHLQGRWAMVLLDKKTQKVYAIRDRFGLKPLYFRQYLGQIYLASEIKQFTILPNWQAKINPARVFDFLKHGHQDCTDETLFDGVHQILPSQYLVIDLNFHKKSFQNYYNIFEAAPPTPQYLSFENAKTTINQHIFESIEQTASDNYWLGSSLSGGLDSSVVTCAAQRIVKEKGGNLAAFSLCLNGLTMDETPYIDAVGQFLNLKVNKIFPDFTVFQQQLSRFLWHQDEPCYTDSVFAQFMVYQKAHECGFKKVLGGTGADAALAGYEKYVLLYVKDLLKTQPIKAVRELLGFAKNNDIRHYLSYFVKKYSLSRQNTSWLTPQYESQFSTQKTESPTTLTAFNHAHYATDAGVVLHYEDRNAAAFGIETFFPFYTQTFNEFCLNLPMNFKIHNGKQKYLLREAAKPYLAPTVYNRHNKIGFYNPGEIWMQQHPDWWSAQMRAIILGNPQFFKPELWEIFNDFAYRNRLKVNERVFWRVFFFGKWLERFDVKV